MSSPTSQQYFKTLVPNPNFDRDLTRRILIIFQI